MISSTPIFGLLMLIGLIAATSTAAASNDTVNHLGVSPTSNLRGSIGGPFNVTVSAESPSNTSASARLSSIIKYHDADIADDLASTSVIIPLHVFLSDTPRILDDVDRFEQAVASFLLDYTNKVSLAKDDAVEVLEQRLIWEEETSSIGLEVHFQVDASLSNDIPRNKLKRAIQKLLVTRSDIFQLYLDKSPGGTDEAESKAMTLSLRPPISFATAALGLCGIVGCISYLLLKARINQSTVKEEAKSNSTTHPTEINSKPTLETSESFANDSYLDHSLTFPMQYHEKQPEEWDDISGPDNLTDDGSGSFSPSVAFCPSVLQRGHELSAIRANIEDNTDSDSSDNDEDASVGKFSSPPLSPEALQEFDIALRRAEF